MATTGNKEIFSLEKVERELTRRMKMAQLSISNVLFYNI